jgi:diguanylate cyclase (GGDEF)-like protein/PAS domain S-box-containing protein
LELGVFVALAAGSTIRWRRRRDETAAWLAAMFTLLGGILLGDRFLPTSLKLPWSWFDRAVILDLAAFAVCLDRFAGVFAGPGSRRGRGAGRGAAVMGGLALLLPDIVGGAPGTWPWWYALYAVVFLGGWTALALRAVDRLWRAGRGQPSIARRRMRLLAVAAVVLNGAVFLVAVSEDHQWAGLISGLLFLVGFAPPAALRTFWRRPELEAFRRAEADLIRADTGAAVIRLMLPHAARLVGARAAAVVDETGIPGVHGTTAADAATIAASLPAPAVGGGNPVFGAGVVAVPFGAGWLVVVPGVAAPFLCRDEIGLLSTLANLARLALERTEMSDRERAGRERLAEREAQLAEAQRTARLGSYTWDVRTGAVDWSDEMHRLLGFAPGTVTDHGAAFASRLHPDDRDRVVAAWAAAPREAAPSSIDYRVVLPGGELRWLQGHVRTLSGPDGMPIQLFGTIQDITERKLAEEAVAFQASHDALTGLPNRTLFLDRAGQALARRTETKAGVAVLFLDVDRFKWLNDSLGHAAGDQLLEVVAGRLRHAVRAEDFVARFGGDEFVVLCPAMEEAEAEAVAARLASSLSAPVTIAGQEMTVTVSIGIACAPATGSEETPAGLVQDADAAMYRAKEEGRNRHSLFDAGIRNVTLTRLETANALRRGIDRGELVVYFQPTVDLTSGRVVGVEALARWNHPTKGLLAPGEFIGLAEDTGLVVPLGTEILLSACRQLALWGAPGSPAEHCDLRLSVNLAARQLLSPELPGVVEEALASSGLDPSRLCLEITESVLLPDGEESIRALRRLKRTGVSIAVDDFGTGFSSLTYLKRFPVDVLKIDRSFVSGLGRNRQDSAIVASVVELAHAFGLTAVAEGVESSEQRAELQRLGCEQGQGFLWSRPLDAGDAGAWIGARLGPVLC